MTADSTPLQHVRDRLALKVGENAVFDGWGKAAVEAAAASEGIDPAQALLAFDGGQMAMIRAYVGAVDAAMADAFPPERVATLKIRQRIAEMVWTRLTVMGPAREAVRSALSIMAMPQNAPGAVRLGWRTADRMWRLAGDTATDFNHYTKRLTLSALYASTLLAWLDDKSEDWSETRAFLDRRIDNVMSFEKTKAQWKGDPLTRPSLARFLGRLRYPPR